MWIKRAAVAAVVVIGVLTSVKSSQAVATDGRWSFDGKPVGRDSGNVGNLSLRNGPKVVAGRYGGKALRLDGRNDFAVVPLNAEGSETAAKQFTFMAWVRPLAVAGQWHAVLSRQSTGTDHQVWIGIEGGKLIATTVGATGRAVATGPALSPGRWVHVAVRSSETELVLFVDGTIVGRAPGVGALVNSDRPLIMGGNVNTVSAFAVEEFFHGDLDSVRLSGAALDDRFIAAQALRSGPTPSNPDTAVKASNTDVSTTIGAAPAAGPTTMPQVVSRRLPLRINEGASHQVTLVLDAPAANDGKVLVGVQAPVGGAGLDSTGSGLDLSWPAEFSIRRGDRSLKVPIRTIEDDLNELEERFMLFVRAPDTGRLLGAQPVDIVDNDTRLVVTLASAGAICDGTTDDTGAVQRAVDAVAKAEGGVVVFPAGKTCVLRSVVIYPDVTLSGYGSTVLRPPQAGSIRTFTTPSVAGKVWAGEADSLPLVIRGLTIDGNSAAQGNYRKFENEHAHLVFVYGSSTKPGRLRFVAEDLNLRNGVADGISVYSNVNATLSRIVATSLFRGGFTITGGHSVVRADRIKTVTGADRTGFDIEVDGPGFGGSLAIDAKLSDLDIDGDIDIATGPGSRVEIDRMVAASGPFTMVPQRSTVIIRNSTVVFGAADSFVNRIVAPGDVQFIDSTIAYSGVDGVKGPLFAVDVWFNHPGYPGEPPARLRFERVAFEARDVGATNVYLTFERGRRPGDVVEFLEVVSPPGGAAVGTAP